MKLGTLVWKVVSSVVIAASLAGCSFRTSATTSGAAAGDESAGKGGLQAAPSPAPAPDAGDAGSIPPTKKTGPPSASTAKDGGTDDTPPPAGKTDGQKPTTEAAAPRADVKALIAGFRSPYAVHVFAAAEEFRNLPPDTRGNVLAELSAHESASVRDNAWRAFATWATRDDVPTVIAALQSPHEDVHAAALELLPRFPNDETIGVLTQVLEDPDFRERAETLLVRVGPAAEGALLSYISHSDAGLRQSAWRVLGQIGTRKSLLALEQVATQTQFQADAELKNVLEKIRQRLRK